MNGKFEEVIVEGIGNLKDFENSEINAISFRLASERYALYDSGSSVDGHAPFA